MSIEVLNYVTTLRVGDTTRKYILSRLADRADERYSCFPSIALLAAEAETSERTVQRHLKELRKAGIISDRERERADGSQTTSRYLIHGPWDDYGGTGVPLPTITTPKQARETLWESPPLEGDFRPDTAAARTLGNSIVSAGRQGVTPMSPPPVTPVTPPPVTPMSPLEPTEETTTTEPGAPSARSAPDARRATAGSSVRASGGCAASGGGKPPKTSPTSTNGTNGSGGGRMSKVQAAAVRTVEAGYPEELVGLLPRYRPAVVRDALLAALEVERRTPDQVAERVRRRWVSYGFALKAHDGELESPVGVLVKLLAPPADCPDPSCEDGQMIDTGAACRTCEYRRQERREGRKRRPGSPDTHPAPPQAAQAATAAPGQGLWECACGTPVKGPKPHENALCPDCTTAQAALTTALA